MLTCTGAGAAGAGIACIAALRTGWATGAFDASLCASRGGVFSVDAGAAGAGAEALRCRSMSRSITVVRDSTRDGSTRTICVLRIDAAAIVGGAAIVGDGDVGDTTAAEGDGVDAAARPVDVSRVILLRALRGAMGAASMRGSVAIAAAGAGVAGRMRSGAVVIDGSDAAGIAL